MDNVKMFRQRMRQARKEKGWSQQVLSDRSGITRETIGHIEGNRDGSPNLYTAILLSQALDVPLDDLCGLDLGVKNE